GSQTAPRRRKPVGQFETGNRTMTGEPPAERPKPASWCGWLWRLPARCAILAVKGYQRFLSPVFGGQCRFHPSCSEYFILAVEKYGVISGSLRGVWRILKCQPFHPGGYDPP